MAAPCGRLLLPLIVGVLSSPWVVHISAIDGTLPGQLADWTKLCRVFPQLFAADTSPWCFVRHCFFDLGKELIVSRMMIL